MMCWVSLYACGWGWASMIKSPPLSHFSMPFLLRSGYDFWNMYMNVC